MKIEDWMREKHGGYKVLSFAGKNEHGERTWNCVCDCGAEHIVTTNHLNRNKYGCFDCGRAHTTERNTKHGDSRERLYIIWSHMIVRCEKEYSSGYENYGGRGIRVCPEWYVYSTFKIWALSNGYSDELSIDRIDVDGNYEPNNCKWSTRGEQADNTRKTKYYEIGGRTNTMSGWCAEYNANRELVKLRVRRGVPILDALTLPKQKPHGIGGKPS